MRLIIEDDDPLRFRWQCERCFRSSARMFRPTDSINTVYRAYSVHSKEHE